MSLEARLKLRAEDAEDLAVISACLQDALVTVGDLAYDRERSTFVLVVNRFRWEARHGARGRDASGPALHRVFCGIVFGAVEGVVYRGFRRSKEDRILSLLTVRATPVSNGTIIDLEFSGGAAIRLEAARIWCLARDLGEPWPTMWQPGHPVDELP